MVESHWLSLGNESCLDERGEKTHESCGDCKSRVSCRMVIKYGRKKTERLNLESLFIVNTNLAPTIPSPYPLIYLLRAFSPPGLCRDYPVK